MASSQADPAYSSTTERANPANPITNPDSASAGQQKTHFADRHKAPTTKDVETNRWTGAPPGTTKSKPQITGEDGGSGVTRKPEFHEGRAVGITGEGYEGTTAREGHGNGTSIGRETYATENERHGEGYQTGTGNNSVARDGEYGREEYRGDGVGISGAGTGIGVRDDGVGVDNGTGDKKMNPLKKVVEAVKHI